MKKTLLLFLLVIPLVLQAHEETLLLKNRNYIRLGLDRSVASFRDFATSPLFYRGFPTSIVIRKERDLHTREVSFGGKYTFGGFVNTYNEQNTHSSFNSIEMDYSRLYQLHCLTGSNYQTFVGGKLIGTAILRQNPSLMNNGVGLEAFTNLMASIKVHKDISREQAKEKWFLFPYTLKPRKRDLDFRFNLGLINGNYRNGYAYSGQSALLNDFNLFDDYNFNLLSGYRFSTELDYTVFLNNNALRFSYVWEALSTSQKTDKLDVAFHTLSLHLLIQK